MDGALALADCVNWSESEFGAAELGDVRRTRRLVTTAARMAQNSSGTIPQQAGTVASAKAIYRLLSCEEVTHEAVCAPHVAQTRAAASQLPLVYLVQDTTELNFTSHGACDGLGPIGHGGTMRGLHQQNVLAVDPGSRRPLGLMLQQHHRRAERPKHDEEDRRAAQRRVPLQARASHWWIESIRTIGSPPAGVQWVHVGDRGEDVFGVYMEAQRTGTDWLIRVAQDRRVQTPGGADHLLTYARSLPALATRELVDRRRGHAEADVQVCISAGPVTLLPTRSDPAYRGESPIECSVVRVWEEKPPAGCEPLEWLLCTSLACAQPEEAIRVAEGYSLRWLIEEFHKCEKTGCQVEMRRLEHIDRLLPLIGLLSVLAVWLLQLKLVARSNPDAPATEVFDAKVVSVMAAFLKKPRATLTVSAFWRGIGQLGGHLGRKGDGPIGWLRAWRGWQAFQLILMGALLRDDLSLNDATARCG